MKYYLTFNNLALYDKILDISFVDIVNTVSAPDSVICLIKMCIFIAILAIFFKLFSKITRAMKTIFRQYGKYGKFINQL